MIRKQLWSPDTCGCIFETSWDDNNPDAEHKLVESVLKCPAHIETDGYTQSLKENRLKNSIIQNLIDNKVLPNAMMDDQIQYDESNQQVTNTKTLHNKVNFKYYFTDDRRIVFSFEGVDKNGSPINLSGTNKSNISNVLDAKLGPGKHEIRDLILEDRNPEYRKHLDIISFRDSNYGALTAKYRQPTKQETDIKSRFKAMKDFISSI